MIDPLPAKLISSPEILANTISLSTV